MSPLPTPAAAVQSTVDSTLPTPVVSATVSTNCIPVDTADLLFTADLAATCSTTSASVETNNAIRLSTVYSIANEPDSARHLNYTASSSASSVSDDNSFVFNNNNCCGPSFFVLNPTSLTKNNKFQLLTADIGVCKPDIIVITESWLKKMHTDEMFSIDNYTILRRDRTKRRGGGVCIYINSEFTSVCLPFVPTESKFEFIWRRITLCENNSFILCALYHPPKSSTTLYKPCELLTELDQIIEKCYNMYPNDFLVVAGDLNSLDVVNLATDHGLVQMVDQPTHGNNILDKFLTNRPDLFNINLLTSSIKTKHKAILVNCGNACCDARPSLSQSSEVKIVHYFYDIREQHMEKLFSAINNFDWHNIQNADQDIDTTYSLFANTCRSLINQHIPLRKVTVGRKDPHFISPLVKTLLRKRNKLMHKSNCN
jgi:hypothetical protein